MKSILCAGVTSMCLLAVATGARADTTFTFSLTPTSTNGGSAVSGTGSFSLNVPPSTSGVTNYFVAGDPANMGNTIDAFSSTVGGNTFGLGSATSNTTIQFTSGSLDDITYSGALFTGSDILALDASGLTFTFDDVATGFSESGDITNVTAMGGTSVTPEPSSLLLLGTGLLGGVGVRRRRLA